VTDSKLRLPKPKPSNHPVDVGQRTEGAVLYELIRRGYAILLPWGVNQRYDLVLDLGHGFVRAQCKTGRLRNGVVIFSTRSIQTNTRRTVIRTYRGEADLFLIYCPETKRVYCVPVEEATGGCMYLRVDPTLNGQRQGVHWARDYELPA
jgi:PD-(D/E)XK nuclease superfamily protein